MTYNVFSGTLNATQSINHNRQALSSLLLHCKIIKLINEAMINSVNRETKTRKTTDVKFEVCQKLVLYKNHAVRLTYTTRF